MNKRASTQTSNMILKYRDIDDFLETSAVPDSSQLSTKRERFYYFKRLHYADDTPAYEKYLDKTVVLSSAQIKHTDSPEYKWQLMGLGWIGKFEIDQLIAVKQANKDSGINTDF